MNAYEPTVEDKYWAGRQLAHMASIRSRKPSPPPTSGLGFDDFMLLDDEQAAALKASSADWHAASSRWRRLVTYSPRARHQRYDSETECARPILATRAST